MTRPPERTANPAEYQKVVDRIDYDPDTGTVIFKNLGGKTNVNAHTKPSNNKPKINADVVCIDYLYFRLTRLVYLKQTGHLPKLVHTINGDRNDLRWCNLTKLTSKIYKERRPNLSTGVKGVTKIRNTKRLTYRSQVYDPAARKNICSNHDTLEAAQEEHDKLLGEIQKLHH